MMKDPLVRFGVAIEGSLLRELDALVARRGGTRSELLRDLARAEVGRAHVEKGVDAVCALTLVYDHHVRDLGEKLTELQHELGEGVRAALHVHLSRDLCLEVVVMRGKSDALQMTGDRILAMRGVKQGGMEIIPAGGEVSGAAPRPGGPGHGTTHLHPHAHPGERPHAHAHAHAHAPATEGESARSTASGPQRGGPPARQGRNGIAPAPARRPPRTRSRRG